MTFSGEQSPGIPARPALTATRSYDPPETYSNGCGAALVEVDPEPGVVTVERVVFADDCGTMLIPMVIDGQIAGSAAHGVGGALHEQPLYDEDGNGCGEGGMIAGPSAVVNAVAAALAPLGVSIERTPLDPNYLRALLREAGGT